MTGHRLTTLVSLLTSWKRERQPLPHHPASRCPKPAIWIEDLHYLFVSGVFALPPRVERRRSVAACRSCFAVQVDPSADETANIVNTAGLSLIMARAVCLLAGDVQGSVSFSQEYPGGPCVITGVLQGLTEGHHGIHILEFGDISQGGNSAGAHFNPLNRSHGGPEDEDRHAGDLGNIEADSQGQAEVNITDNVVSLTGEHSVIGRTLAVFEGVDDLGRGGHELSLRTAIMHGGLMVSVLDWLVVWILALAGVSALYSWTRLEYSLQPAV